MTIVTTEDYDLYRLSGSESLINPLLSMSEDIIRSLKDLSVVWSWYISGLMKSDMNLKVLLWMLSEMVTIQSQTKICMMNQLNWARFSNTLLTFQYRKNVGGYLLDQNLEKSYWIIGSNYIFVLQIRNI